MPLVSLTENQPAPTPEESNATITQVQQPQVAAPSSPIVQPQADYEKAPAPGAPNPSDSTQTNSSQDTPFTAGFKLNNPMYNWATSETAGQALGGTVDPNYDFFSGIKGTKYMANASKFAETVNDQEAQQLKDQIDKESEWSQIASQGHFSALLGGIVGAVIDPTILIPGLAQANELRTGLAVAKSFGQTAALGATAIGAEEAQLQITQENRPIEESLYNIAGAALVGGAIGGIASGFTAARIAAQKKVAASIFSGKEVSPADIQISEPELADLHSAGAAEAQLSKPEDVKFKPVFMPNWISTKFPSVAEQLDKYLIKGFGLQVAGLKTPSISGILSDSFVVRDTTRRLFNLPLQLKEQMTESGYTGKAAVIPMENKTWMDANDAAQLMNSFDTDYQRYLERTGKDPTFLTKNREKTLFNEEGMKAYNRGGVSDIPEAREMATRAREQIQAVNKRMVELKIIDEESAAAIDRGDAMRVWDTKKVASTRSALRNTLMEHFDSKQSMGIPQDRLTASSNIDNGIDSILHLGDEQIALSDMNRLSTDKGIRFTKARSIDAPNTVVENWTVNDLPAVTNLYLQQASKLIRFQESLNGMGYESISALLKGVKDEYTGKKINVTRKAAEAEIRATNPGKYDKIDTNNVADFQAKVTQAIESGKIDVKPNIALSHEKLDKQATKQIDFLNDLLSIALGQYSMKTGWDNALKTLRTYNASTMLGQVVVSSVADLAMPMIRHGLTNTVTGWEERIRTQFIPSIKALSDKDAKELGMAVEYQQNSIINSYFEASQTNSLARSGVDKWNHILQTASGKVTGISQWTNFGKNLTTHIATNDIMSRLENYASLSDHSKTFLNEHFIDENMGKRILQQQQKWGIRNGPTWILNIDKWTDAGAVTAMKAAVTKNVRSSILSPGKGEGSMWLQRSELGKTLFQFQSFMMSATGNVFLRSLQQRDAHILSSILGMSALGILSQLLKDKIAGRKSDYSTSDLIKLAISNSGLGGLLASEAFNLVLRSPVNSKNAHRYQDKGVVEYLGGPSASTLNNAYKLVMDLGSGDLSPHTAKTALKLVPYNNLFYIKGLIRALDH